MQQAIFRMTEAGGCARSDDLRPEGLCGEGERCYDGDECFMEYE